MNVQKTITIDEDTMRSMVRKCEGVSIPEGATFAVRQAKGVYRIEVKWPADDTSDNEEE